MGIHFAVTAKEAQRLKEAPDDEAVIELIEQLEEAWDAWEAKLEEGPVGRQWGGSDAEKQESYPWAIATDRAWDAIHRCLGNGQLGPIAGPLGQFTFGGEPLCDEDYLAFLVKPSDAKAAALAAGDLNRATFRERFLKLDPIALDRPVSEEEFEFTWGQFQALTAFYRRAGASGRAVLFTLG